MEMTLKDHGGRNPGGSREFMAGKQGVYGRVVRISRAG